MRRKGKKCTPLCILCPSQILDVTPPRAADFPLIHQLSRISLHRAASEAAWIHLSLAMAYDSTINFTLDTICPW